VSSGGTTVSNSGTGNTVSNNTTTPTDNPGFTNGSGDFSLNAAISSRHRNHGALHKHVGGPKAVPSVFASVPQKPKPASIMQFLARGRISVE
jgi:hypothetical protein